MDFFGGSNSSSASYSWDFDINGLGGVSPTTSTDKDPAGIVLIQQVILMLN